MSSYSCEYTLYHISYEHKGAYSFDNITKHKFVCHPNTLCTTYHTSIWEHIHLICCQHVMSLCTTYHTNVICNDTLYHISYEHKGAYSFDNITKHMFVCHPNTLCTTYHTNIWEHIHLICCQSSCDMWYKGTLHITCLCVTHMGVYSFDNITKHILVFHSCGSIFI